MLDSLQFAPQNVFMHLVLKRAVIISTELSCINFRNISPTVSKIYKTCLDTSLLIIYH